MTLKGVSFGIVLVLLMASCSVSKVPASVKEVKIGSLKFINEYIVPNDLKYKNTVVGGLSGIDYDPAKKVYYMICDDPSAYSPARFYTAKINIGNRGIDSVEFVEVATVLNEPGEEYPDIKKDRIHSADLEAMRYNPLRSELIRTSEGQRVIRTTDSSQLQDPDIVIMDINGHYKDSFELPDLLRMNLAPKGPRHNSVLEGIAFNADYSHVYVSVEDALYDDGPKAGTGDSTAVIRIFDFNRETKKQVAQYAYKVDPVPHPAVPAGAFKINGVSDIMYAGGSKLLVIERAWSTGQGIYCNIRVYLADLKGADNILKIPSLTSGSPVKEISKRLLVNMDSLPVGSYNIEGATFGPRLANGHESLIFVADNNFNPKERSQFLLFEIIP